MRFKPMPDLPKRNKAERALALLIEPELVRQTKAMLSAGLRPIHDLTWLELRNHLGSAMQPQLRRNYELAALLMLTSDSVPISADDLGPGYVSRISVRAQHYAEQRAAAVADLVTVKIRKSYGDILREVEARQLEAAKAVEKIEAIATKARAERIAVTETTAATTAGESGIAQISQQSGGPVIRPHWNTEQDERVCQICMPLHREWLGDVPREYQAGPPAHVMCRCWLTWERVSEPVPVQRELPGVGA